jgi:hypothetical protein
VQNNRGYVADFQIIDEAAFVKRALIESCVLPVGLNTHVTTVLASTPGDAESWFMQAIRLVDDESGLPIVPIKRAYEPCDMHKKTRTPWVCACKLDQRAAWKNLERERVWSKLWFSRQDTFIAENLGLQVATGNVGFHPDSVQRFLDRPRFPITASPPVIFIAIDPAEGGPDEFAITAAADVGNQSYAVRSFIHSSSKRIVRFRGAASSVAATAVTASASLFFRRASCSATIFVLSFLGIRSARHLPSSSMSVMSR